MLRRTALAMLAATGLSALPLTAIAQTYPAKPITLIVPWPAGGSSDIAMRAIADAMAKILGQPMVVDNKPGASGTLVNTATAGVPAGWTDPNAGNNSATDTDTLTPQSDLAVTKTDGSATAVPGSPISYTVTVSNNGPSNVTAATFTDTVPAAVTGVAWSCSITTGVGLCGSSLGSGNAIATTLDLSPGATATFAVCDCPPSNWTMFASIQCLAKSPSAFAT